MSTNAPQRLVLVQYVLLIIIAEFPSLNNGLLLTEGKHFQAGDTWVLPYSKK